MVVMVVSIGMGKCQVGRWGQVAAIEGVVAGGDGGLAFFILTEGKVVRFDNARDGFYCAGR